METRLRERSVLGAWGKVHEGANFFLSIKGAGGMGQDNIYDDYNQQGNNIKMIGDTQLTGSGQPTYRLLLFLG